MQPSVSFWISGSEGSGFGDGFEVGVGILGVTRAVGALKGC